MSFASLCTSIIGELEADLPDYEWHHGWVDDAESAAAERKHKGFVFGVGKQENEANVNEERVEIGIRVFPNRSTPRGQPRDPTAFENIAESVQTALRDKQTTLPQGAGAWFMRVTELAIDHERQMVEFRVIVWQFGVFTAFAP